MATADVSWVDTTDGFREFRIGCTVHPDHRRGGIGRWLLRTCEERAAARLREQPTERPVVLGTWCPEPRTGALALMAAEGYLPARYFFDMECPSLEGIVLPPMPAGLETRPVVADQLRQLWAADVEAFADHWGGFDASDARFESWRNDPKFDMSLHVVAWEGNEIAGGVINEINEAENAGARPAAGMAGERLRAAGVAPPRVGSRAGDALARRAARPRHDQRRARRRRGQRERGAAALHRVRLRAWR